MTVGEVFDFSINDVFEYKLHGNTPPNNQRITITAKYNTSDSVFYGRFHENYSLVFNPNPVPHADTVFSSNRDTIYYTHLNELITDYDLYFLYDTTIYYSDNYCGILINAHLGMVGDSTTFEPPTVDREYGRGLGLVNSLDIWADNGGVPYGFYMTYYKKGTAECGVSDTLTVGINENQKTSFSLYPNPTTSTLTIQNASGLYHLSDITGKTLLSGLASGETTFTLDISTLSSGVYFLTLSEGGQQVVRKVVKQ